MVFPAGRLAPQFVSTIVPLNWLHITGFMLFWWYNYGAALTVARKRGHQKGRDGCRRIGSRSAPADNGGSFVAVQRAIERAGACGRAARRKGAGRTRSLYRRSSGNSVKV